MSQPTIYPLFSTPVYVNNVGDFARPDMAPLAFSSGDPDSGQYGFASSVDKNVLDRPDFAHVREIVMKEVEFYARELLSVNRSIEFYVTNSWVNVHGRGQAAGAHMHHNSLISGVLYLEVTETSGDLVFFRNPLSLIPFPPTLDLDMDAFNIYNCKNWSYRPKRNDIVLFPSVVTHAADRNESAADRWCLAFNVYARGDIGTFHKLRIR